MKGYRRYTTEGEWMATVSDLAALQGWANYHTYDSRRSKWGFPDLCLVRPPRIIFAELKSERGRPSDAQRYWLDLLTRCPVEAYLWRPDDWDAVQRILSRDNRTEVRPWPVP
jgi:hypothetical protein